jgi:DNA-binding PadR family transcriptional regulator
MGLIEEAPVEGTRKPFQVTDDGRKHLEEKAEEIEGLFERLKELNAASSYPQGGSPVWRAMRNLGVAIRNRLGRGDVNEETLHELAALIDEFAQRIERIK